MVRAVGEEPRARRRSSRARTSTTTVLGRAARARRGSPTRPAARSRSKPSRAPRRTTPRSSSGSRTASALPAHLVLPLDAHRRDAALRREPAPAGRALPHASARRAGGTASCSTAGSRSATSTSTTPTPRGSSCTTSATAPACAIIKHANPCGVAVADDLATAYQRALECDERSAFGGIVAFNRPIDDATAAAMVDGSAGRRRDRARVRAAARSTRCSAKRKNTRLLEAPAPERADARRSARSAAGSSCRTPRHFAADARRLAGRHQGRADRRAVGRCRAGVAGLRPREVERDRAGEGRPGRRHRRRAAEPGRVGRDRGEEGRRPRAWAARARRDAFYPFPDGVEAAAAAGVAVVIQPGGSVRDDEGHRPGRRARPRHGLHRRTPLPALMRREHVMP